MLKDIKGMRLASGALGCMLLGLSVGFLGCQRAPQSQQQAAVSSPASPVEEGLTAENVTLEQKDKNGQPLWKLEAAKTKYSKERKYVYLEGVKGNLYQDGKIVLQVRSRLGELEENGKKVLLKDQIVAIDPRNQAVMKADEFEWRPEEDVAIARKNLTGSNGNINASATEGRYQSRSQRLELLGQAKAIAKDPALQLQAERLLWEIPTKVVSSDRPIAVDRYQGKNVSDRLVAKKGQINLATQIATVEGNVELKSLEPKMQIASNSASWNLKNRTVQTNQPTRVLHHQAGFTATGNQGFIDIERQLVRLQGGTQAINLRKKANLYANQLIWQIPQKLLFAEGNVIYDQADPPLHLEGPKATGNLDTQQIEVAGNTGGQVVTEIAP
ncbi:LPS export ABC transporter periplasmic protein LptC [Oscillatoria sp. FACHB-1406]|uniref:LPS export ABC transporter periplasmic protein LptC n=1 Tax=Oscillatoria sp. FACHB-1406 TaxID=2692846 RepID=UPI001688618A|nr:LPS export ABC transporter periplasmic protein LptC [Oscillatoria sp. FACHB-1406]MBD2577217.1 LPS export ABC transporter periplasmic protein LptC [Oscillatoria sp. FACHB-1406]